jgi:hypothetical protein
LLYTNLSTQWTEHIRQERRTENSERGERQQRSIQSGDVPAGHGHSETATNGS